MKKIILYGQILLVVLMVQNVNADTKADDPLRATTEAEHYDIDQLSNQIDFFHIRTPIFMPTMDQARGLFDNGLMTRRQLRNWIFMMEPKTDTEKDTYNKLFAMFIPQTDTVAASKKRTEIRTDMAQAKIKIAREARDNAKLAIARHNALMAQEKSDRRTARKLAKTEATFGQ